MIIDGACVPLEKSENTVFQRNSWVRNDFPVKLAYLTATFQHGEMPVMVSMKLSDIVSEIMKLF